ncbi:MAG TPA: ATP-binding protein, partial [Acidimicrobiia bacterium]|nr:ATP-binding protein [Acidimicrobiia bacterium]
MQAPPTISVTLPAAPDYLRLARLATADVGSRAGFGYEEIDDLRIAVSELCTLISGHEGATLTLDFWFDEASVTVAGQAVPGLVVENQLSRAIVHAVVD